MTRWTAALLRRLASPDIVEDVLGDLEEAHRARLTRMGPLRANLHRALETLDVVQTLLRERHRTGRLPAEHHAGPVHRRRALSVVSWLDFKLGIRMLVRYPGLTLVGGLAMAVSIWMGAGTFELVKQWVDPNLPLEDGDRIVGLRLWDSARLDEEGRALHDFFVWRGDLKSVDELSAFRTLSRNLIVGEGGGGPVEVAEMNASAFRLARVNPILGRSVTLEDELAGAPAVVVIGHEVWQARFGGDPRAVGRTVRLGDDPHTVIGVMPAGFEFPVAQDAWTPLRLSALDDMPRNGPSIRMLGRLAPGVSLSEAQAELTSLGMRAAADFPLTHEYLRPQVMPYAHMILDVTSVLELLSLNLFVVMLLALVCGNVALLMFARASARESEIVVRTALGASRGRIVAQLFAEALVLGVLGAAVGLAAAGYGLRWGLSALELNLGRMPFWFDDRLSLTTVLYAALLAVLGAGIAGVVPALRVTRGLGPHLRQAAAGAGGLRFSGLWTVIIVAQVAVTVAFPSMAFHVRKFMGHVESIDVGFAAEDFVSVELEMEAVPADTSRRAFLARFRKSSQELERRLSAHPAVDGVTFADRLPRMLHGSRSIDFVDDASAVGDSVPGVQVNAASVDADFFDVLGADVLAGRTFNQADLASAHRVVVVNQSFVERVLGGRNAIGRRVRFKTLEEQNGLLTSPFIAHEIVGVVEDLGMNYLGSTDGTAGAGLYELVAADGAHPIHMAVKVRDDADTFGRHLQTVASAVDPTLRLTGIERMDRSGNGVLKMLRIFLQVTSLLSAVALLLALAGIYAVTSFSVSRRTREIGIRVALGSSRRSVMLAIFSRPIAQVGLGVIVGGVLTALLSHGMPGGGLSPRAAALIAAYAALMMCICLLACAVPTRRALRVQPGDALRDDG